jgi:hypothetical protein
LEVILSISQANYPHRLGADQIPGANHSNATGKRPGRYHNLLALDNQNPQNLEA